MPPAARSRIVKAALSVIDYGIPGHRSVAALLFPHASDREQARFSASGVRATDMVGTFLRAFDALASMMRRLYDAALTALWEDAVSADHDESSAAAMLMLADRLPDRLDQALRAAARIDKPQRAQLLARISLEHRDATARRTLLDGAVEAEWSLSERRLRAEALFHCAMAADEPRRTGLITDA